MLLWNLLVVICSRALISFVQHQVKNAQDDHDDDCHSDPGRKHDKCELERFNCVSASQAHFHIFHVEDCVVVPHKGVTQDPEVRIKG